MTNTFAKAVVLVVAACSAASFARGQELFSGPTIEAALGALTGGNTAPPAEAAPATPAPTAPVAAPVEMPVVAPAVVPNSTKLALPQIADMLNAAGMEPQKDGEFIVVAKVAFDQWKFPVAVTLSGDGERIHMAMMLARYEQKQPTVDKLLSLLATNRTHQPAFFSYSEERKQVELLSSVMNDRPTIDAIRGELERMATIAGKTITLWEPNLPSGVNQAPAGQPNGQQAAPQGGASVLGKWSAARSQTEAFALMLNEDASFTLVFVKEGKMSRSNGRFTIGNNQLNLNADNGARIAGSFAMTSENTFELVPGGNPAQRLVFNRSR